MAENVDGKDAYRLFADAQLRFEYFVTGGAGVALAYSLKEFTRSAGPVGYVLVPVAWALLLASLGCGLAGLHALVEALRHETETHRQRFEQAQLRSAILTSTEGRIVEMHTGDTLDSEAVAQQLAESATLQHSATEATFRHVAAARWLGRGRDVNLMLAFGVIAMWRWLNL